VAKVTTVARLRAKTVAEKGINMIRFVTSRGAYQSSRYRLGA